MEVWITEGYNVGFLKWVAVVSVKGNLGVKKDQGQFVSGGSFEGDSDVNIEGVGPGEGDTLSFL